MISAGKLGVGVCGLGVGEQHARTFRALARCSLRWLYDINRDRAAKLIADLGAGEAASDFATIVDSPEVQIVSIASYDECHFEQVMGALAARKHVFVEKPLCQTLRQLETIKHRWIQSSESQLESNLVLRAAPLYRWLREAIQAGELGTIYSFDGDYLYGRLEKLTRGWRKETEDYSVMSGGGIHLIDLMLWLTGERPSMAHSVGNRICTNGTAFRYEDFVATTFRFESGMVGRITANFGCVHRHHHVVRIFGTRATFIYDDQGARLHRTSDPASRATFIELGALPESKGALIPRFVERIDDQRRSESAAQHEFDLMSVCVAANESLRMRATAPIRYV